MTRADIVALLRDARMRNLDREITGNLLRVDNAFLHYLEGPLSALEGLLDSIRKDPRHASFEELYREPLCARRYAGSHLVFTEVGRTAPHQGAARALLQQALELAPPADGRGSPDDVFHRVWDSTLAEVTP